MRRLEAYVLRRDGGGVAVVGEGAGATLQFAAAAGVAPPPLRGPRREVAEFRVGAAAGQGGDAGRVDAAAADLSSRTFAARSAFTPTA